MGLFGKNGLDFGFSCFFLNAGLTQQFGFWRELNGQLWVDFANGVTQKLSNYAESVVNFWDKRKESERHGKRNSLMSELSNSGNFLCMRERSKKE